MIDLRAARSDPETFRTALARKGAADVFDQLLEADAGWREVNTRRDEVRARQKAIGKRILWRSLPGTNCCACSVMCRVDPGSGDA